jgi:putative phosphotransacetylase
MKNKKIEIPVEVSARHCHLSKEDSEKLFGKDYKLKKLKQLYQPGDFASEEVVDLKFDDKKIERLRVVGPFREKTQVEISKTDAIGLGANPPVRLSGNLGGSERLILVGPKGEVKLEEGLIIAKRHIHCATEEIKDIGLKNGDIVSVRIESERPVTFHDVEIRVSDNYKLCLHLDTDEGNSAGINKIGKGLIV